MKTNFFILVGLGLMAGLLTVPAAQAETVTVGYDDLPRLVSSQNKNVLADESFVKGSKAQTGHLKRSFLPQVRAQGGGEIFQTGTSQSMTQPVGQIEGKMNLFRSGKDALEEQIRQKQFSLSQANARQRAFHELARARTLYAEASFFREGMSGVQDVSRRTNGLIDRIQKRIEAGLVTEADRLELEIFRSRLQQEKFLLQEDYEHAINDLKVALGFPLNTDLRLRASVTSRLQIPAFDARIQPEVKAFQTRAEVSHLQKKQAGRWWAPSVDAYGSYALYPFHEREYLDRADRDEALGGVRVSIDLFDGLHGASQNKSLGLQAKGYALEAEQKSLELEVHHERLRHELKTRKQLIGLLSGNVARVQRHLEMNLDEYDRGIRSSPELFATLQSYLDEKKRLSETRRDYLKIQAELLALSGQE